MVLIELPFLLPPTGDAPLRFAMVTMFFDKMRQVKEFCDIPYVHYMKAPNNCACQR